MDNKDKYEICPGCLGSSYIFDGNDFNECYICAGEGKVDSRIYEDMVKKIIKDSEENENRN